MMQAAAKRRARMIAKAKAEVGMMGHTSEPLSKALAKELEAAHDQLARIQHAWSDCAHFPETATERRNLHQAIIGTTPN